jgi:3-hydroxymyristoyl/3-hydroxydecanoyl-(acyl carrier protein) dehydratase
MELGTSEGGLCQASFVFPPDFIAFQGHFPGMPVLPGACQIQCLLSMLEELGGKPLALKEIVLAKYLSPILPDETITVRLADPFDPDLSEAIVKATILRKDVKVSEIKIRTALQEKQAR